MNLTPAPILDGYFDPRSEEADFDILPSQPILEREVRPSSFVLVHSFFYLFSLCLAVCGSARALRGGELWPQRRSCGLDDAIPLHLPLLGRAGKKYCIVHTHMIFIDA